MTSKQQEREYRDSTKILKHTRECLEKGHLDVTQAQGILIYNGWNAGNARGIVLGWQEKMEKERENGN